MAINKVGSKGIEDGSVAVADFKDGDITADKLNSTLDLSSNTVTLPNTSVTNAQLAGSIANSKLSNSSITATGTSISLGGSATFNNKFTDWQSVVTGDTTMVASRGYFVDTSSSTVTMTLPSSASIGDFVAIKDYAGTFNTNNLTIARNGHNIQGEAVNSLITTNRASLVLVYVDSTKGWLYWEEHGVGDLQQNVNVAATGGTVATSGDYKIHTFTGDGNFIVSAGIGPVSVVDYMVVAGGGAGGGIMGGGGGAGGYRESHSTPVSGPYTASPLATPTGIPVTGPVTIPVTVGGGGSSAGPGGGYPAGSGTGGSNSVFSTITSAGGGAHSNGVSGVGGSGAGHPRYTGTGAAGNTPPVSPPQGQPGGDVPSRPSHQDNIGGGGGGAGQAGGDANSDPYPTPSVFRAGPGGNGVASEISGSSVTRAGGGGGGSRTGSPTHYAPSGATGGSGGGGVGGHSPNAAQCNGVAGTPGSANTGGGGGGGLYHAPNLPAPFPQMPGQQDRCMPGGNGGKGIVIIRYKFQ